MDIFLAAVPEYAKELRLPPRKERGWVHEVEVSMRAGDMIHFASEHDGPGGRVEFNIHSHHGKEVNYHQRSSDFSLAGSFSAPWEGKFFLMWENVSDEPIQVRIHANRHEVRPEPVAEEDGHSHP